MIPQRRRHILGETLLLLAFVVPFARAQQGLQTSSAMYDPDLHLFVDDSGIDREWQMARVLGSPQRLPQPVVVPDQPWEKGPDRLMFTYGGTGSVIYDPDQHKFRMWYGVISLKGDPKVVPAFICYAESDDGIHWRKPSLAIYDYAGSKQNNIVYMTGGTTSLPYRYLFAVFRDEIEPDPVKRYKGIGWVQANGYHVVTSPDGLHWSRPPKLVSTIGGDTMGMTWDPIRKTYLMSGREHGLMSSKTEERGGGPVRTVGIFESPTMDRWRYQGTGIALDETEGFGRIEQHWAMNPFVYGNQYVGLVNVAVMHEAGLANRLELLSSQDGRSWHYVHRRQTFFVQSPGGYWDGGTLCLSSGPPIPVGDDVYIYYTSRPTSGIFTIGMAKVRRDRFAGLRSVEGQVLEGDPHATTGLTIEPVWGNFHPPYVLTKPLKITGPKLEVNLRTQPGGILRVSVRQPYVDNNNWGGQPIAEFTSEECTPLSGDGTRLEVHWKNRKDLSRLIGEEVEVMFELKDGTLWSYRFGH